MMKHGESKDNIYNTKIETASKINAQNIDEANYFMTLVNEALSADILREIEIEYMQSQILDILSDNIWQYNGGASTSVTTEIAEDLTESIVFTLDCFCLFTVNLDNINNISVNSTSNDKCVEMLREKAGIKNCYLKGIEYIEKILNPTKSLYNDVYISKLNIAIERYNTTINKTTALFFKNYNRFLLAHKKNPLEPVIDYQLALLSEIKEYKGILYTRKYLKYLQLENGFCFMFDTNDIRRLIRIYADSMGFYIGDLAENIFEIVFKNAFFSMFLGLNNSVLSINKDQVKKITEHFYDDGRCKEEIDIYILTDKYIQKLMLSLKIENSELKQYILKYSEKFAKNILYASQKGYLHNLIICN